MTSYVLQFQEIDRDRIETVGGKGANLGELSRVDGVQVPPGFCVTTDAFRRILSTEPELGALIGDLARLEPHDGETIAELCTAIRRTIEQIAIPGDLEEAITRALSRLGEGAACAVRSSATAEDLATASFAGQQDSYLNIVGPAAILQHISRCWASLFTERAVIYRLRQGIDSRSVAMGVVVQQMVEAEVSGVLFTADPLTGNRRIAVVEAVFGLGETLVSGEANADVYRVRDGVLLESAIAAKRASLRTSAGGGTRRDPVELERQQQPALSAAQVVRLEELGRRIEAHFGAPQDVEWCLADGEFHIVQSRPITTLFPIPGAADGENHVFLSVGHQQMMTDPMKPLGISLWQLTSGRPMLEAGGRLFVDVTRALASPGSRAGLLEMLGRAEPLMRDALQTVLDRGDFVPSLPDPEPGSAPFARPPPPLETDPQTVVGLIGRTEDSLAALKREIRGISGPPLFDFLRADIQELKRILFDPQSIGVIMAAMEAAAWLNDRLEAWLGEKNAADVLTQSVPHNVTSEMGLALLDVADVIRPHREVVSFLEAVEGDDFLDELPVVPGGRQARSAIQGWLERYGMRCVGEIDITRPRWRERPSALIPLLLANVRNLASGAAETRFEAGRREALERERELLSRLRDLPDGGAKADETARVIARLRTFSGYREYPKYAMVNRFFVYRQALLGEAGRLVRDGVIGEQEDTFYLTFDEFEEAVRTNHLDHDIVRQRKVAFRSYHALRPPRVITSEGEAIVGAYRRHGVPAGALVGLAVSPGTVEGRARIVLELAEADLDRGDILVTAFTDPSWTPVFLGIAGLVTEVGGLMTHGAVIAREYGLPAVVGVTDATRLIADGQRIRVDGAGGYVEILA